MVEIQWTLDANVANSILAVLGKLPYNEVATTIQSLRQQTDEQLKAKMFPEPPNT